MLLASAIPAAAQAQRTVRLAVCQILVIDGDRDADLRVIDLAIGSKLN